MSLRVIAVRAAVASLVVLAPIPAAAQLSALPGSQFVPGLPQLLAPVSPVTDDEMPHQVISANPIGFMFTFINAEYERRFSRFVTAGAGASRWSHTGLGPGPQYRNGDLFLRYYPGGGAFNGFSVGAKASYTELASDGRFLGLGFDLNHSVMLSPHLYLGVGMGARRLLHSFDDDSGLRVVPSLRLNVGVGF